MISTSPIINPRLLLSHSAAHHAPAQQSQSTSRGVPVLPQLSLLACHLSYCVTLKMSLQTPSSKDIVD